MAVDPNFSAQQAYIALDKQLVSGHLGPAAAAAKAYLQEYEDQPFWNAKFKIELARILLYQGQSRQVIWLLAPALPAGAGEEELTRRHLLCALAYVRLGDADLAQHELDQTSSSKMNGSLRAETVLVRGSMLLDQEHLDAAEEQFHLALDEAREHDNAFLQAQVTMNLGVIALRRQRFDEASNDFILSAKLAQSIGADQAYEKALGNLGRTYYQTGDFVRARKNAIVAVEKAEALQAHFDEAYWLTNKGLSERALGNLVAARLSFEKALKLAEELQNPGLILSAHFALSYLLFESQPELAALHVSAARRLAQDDANPDEILEAILIESLLAMRRDQPMQAEAALLKLVKQSTAAPSFQWEAENTLAALYDKIGRPQKAERWYRRAIETFHRQRLTLKSVELQLPFLENGSDLYMGYMEHLIRAGRTEEALALLDTSRAETLAEGLGAEEKKTGRAADARTMAASLHATVLVYCLRPERSYLWAITGKERKFYTLPGSGAILPLVARHNEAILGAKDLLAQKDSTARALYDALLAPASGLLPKHGGRVVLVADSALSRLNFETLIPPGDTPHYWVEDASVTNARSLRLLAAGRDVQSAGTPGPKLLLIGDPLYAKGEYAPLPNAKLEMSGIAEHFAPAERLVASGRDASPEAYPASKPGRFRFLHFVAHATASELNPLDSAVILSSKGTGATNKLYAGEILKQPLSAELVTLSSCYSSGTRNYTGEGVVGLAWAFLRAGAHSVIGALWEVSDVSTPKLMDTLYTRLLAGDAPDAALREAKLEMLRSEGVFRKPVYWAAFQLYAGR